MRAQVIDHQKARGTLRRRRPDTLFHTLPFAGTISAGALVFLFLNEDYRVGVFGCAIWFVAGILYFAVHSRHHMVLSPEEEFALRQRVETNRSE